MAFQEDDTLAQRGGEQMMLEHSRIDALIPANVAPSTTPAGTFSVA